MMNFVCLYGINIVTKIVRAFCQGSMVTQTSGTHAPAKNVKPTDPLNNINMGFHLDRCEEIIKQKQTIQCTNMWIVFTSSFGVSYMYIIRCLHGDALDLPNLYSLCDSVHVLAYFSNNIWQQWSPVRNIS